MVARPSALRCPRCVRGGITRPGRWKRSVAQRRSPRVSEKEAVTVALRPSIPRGPVRGIVLPAAAVALGAVAFGKRRRSRRRPAWPTPDDGIRAADSFERTVELMAKRRIGRDDLAMPFAPALATSVEPLLHGRRYFPKMLEDIEAARDHIHILIYGYKEGDIGRQYLAALAAKAAEGVEVRLIVDAIGSEIDGGSRKLYRDLQAAGVAIVANEGIASFRTGPLGARRRTRHWADFLHFDHRKMLVIDGRVAYVGGSGIEDHYASEQFYDVMCRMTGPVVAQLALTFLATWRHHEGHAPTSDLARYFPPDVVADVADP